MMSQKDGQWYEGVPETPGIYWMDGYDYPVAVTHPRFLGIHKRLYCRIGDIPQKPPMPQSRPEKIDTPVLVRDISSQEWFKRYLAGWDTRGRIMTFKDGKTSWSANDEQEVIAWSYWKLPEDE